MSYSVIGKSHPRLDALSQMTGRSKYGEDVNRPNQLWCKILRSEYAHAKILSIDTKAAQSFPGVRGVATAKDVPCNVFGFTHQDQSVIADYKVRWFGDPVAAVAADTADIAQKALELIKVEYEQLPILSDPFEARKDEVLVHDCSNIASNLKIRNGDIEEGWAKSDVIIEEYLSTPMIEHAMIEPHAAVAEYGDDGMYTIWAALQRPFTIAADLAKILQVPLNKIRVRTTAIGGGFGGKNESSFEPILCILARKTGHPVKHVYTREDEFHASTVRHPYSMKYKTGLKKDGTFVARQVEIVSDCGPYVNMGESTLTKALIHAAGPYNIPYTKIDAYLVYTNNPLGGAMRGFGVTQLGFAYETHMDTIAAEMNISPVELRIKNMIKDGDTLITGQQLEQVNLGQTMKKAFELADWKV